MTGARVPAADELGIPEAAYPFEGKVLDLDGSRMHYLDEGTGDPVVMLHGNPSWSIYYRKLVLALRDQHRCIVPDHIGCGLSDKPGDAEYDYTLQRRVDDVERLIEAVVPNGALTLAVHDWGGMIGMAYAVRHPERIRRLIVLNTSAFHLPESKSFPWMLRLCRTPVGALLVRGLNAFSGTATRVCVRRRPMPTAIRLSYVAPYNSWKNRIATLRFVQDIPLRPEDRAYAIVSEVQENIEKFEDTPTLVCWGMQDFVFDRHFLALWERAFPHADVYRFEDCGHYVLEDAPDEITALVSDFLERT